MAYKLTERLFKVIIIGDSHVGKTSFVQRYVNDSFRRDMKKTIGVDFALKVVKWSDQEMVKLQLWDIAGQERTTSMTRVYYKETHACVLMFDLTDKSTFANAAKWKEDLDSKCCMPDGSKVPCILLANKCDLSNRAVNQTDIEEFSEENDFLMWSEVSVKENKMIAESMTFLIEKLLDIYSADDDSYEDNRYKHAASDGPSSGGTIKLEQDNTTQSSKCPC